MIEDLREKLKALGLDPSEAEAIVKKSRQSGVVRRPPTEPFAIQPQKKGEKRGGGFMNKRNKPPRFS